MINLFSKEKIRLGKIIKYENQDYRVIHCVLYPETLKIDGQQIYMLTLARE